MKKSQKKTKAGRTKQDQLQQLAKQQEKFLELARDLAETLDLNTVLERITNAAKKLLHAHAIAIYLPAEDGKTLKPVAAIDAEYEDEILAKPIPIESSLTGRAMKARKTLIFNDAGTNPAGYQIPGTSKEQFERVIVTPFVADDNVLGAMCLNRLEDDFIESDRVLAEIFAMHATNALKNAQIHQSLQQEMKERKRVEKELLANEEKFKIIFECAPDAIYINGLLGEFIDCNMAAERLTGYTKKELNGKNMLSAELLSIKHALKAAKLLALNIIGKPTGPDELILTRKDGSQVTVEIRTYPVRIRGKTVVLGIARDITERNSIQQQKQRIQELLLQSQKMESIGRLAGGVAHEFNNLLTGIIGFCELLLNQLSQNSPLRADVFSIIGAAKQAASLAHQLLAFSRKKKMEFNSLDLNKIIRGMKHMLKNLAGENVNIDYHLDPSIPTVDSDSSLIEQIIINLATNVCDAMTKGGILTISTRNILFNTKDLENLPTVRAGNFVSLIISDTGVGMNEEIIHRMFEPFFGTKIVGDGAGLGLSVVYGIVKQHAGWIDVESEKGKGSQFNIFLPATETVIKPAGKRGKGKEKTFGNGESILVVEDEEIVRELASRVLRENDYVVFEAANSTEARDIFNREKGNFDLVFSDVIMPDENGPQLVDQLLLSRPHLKALFSSGYSDEKSQRAIIVEKGFPFLQKPYTPSDLLLAVRDIIAQT